MLLWKGWSFFVEFLNSNLRLKYTINLGTNLIHGSPKINGRYERDRPNEGIIARRPRTAAAGATQNFIDNLWTIRLHKIAASFDRRKHMLMMVALVRWCAV